MPRLGIFGGTFDPVHHGHLILARDAVEQLGLARMIFIPAAISPHKLACSPRATGEQRLELLRTAIAGEPAFTVDDRELHRDGPSYSFDTVTELRADHPDAEFHYLIGADNVRELHSWHRIGELRALATFVFFHRRTGDTPIPGTEGFPSIERVVDVSSTEVRNRIASGLSIRYLVPQPVADLIESRGLYRNLSTAVQGAPSLPLKK